MNTPQVPTSHMKVLQFAKQFQSFMISLMRISAWPLRALAQDSHSHTTQQQQELTPEQQSQQSALLKIVRESTARFQDVRMAESEGYRLEFGCVSGPDSGEIGLHYGNGTLVGNGMVDATCPQIVLYEAQPNGDLKLTARTIWSSPPYGMRNIRAGRRSSWDSSLITSSLRSPGLLYLAWLGVEGESQWRICKLAPPRRGCAEQPTQVLFSGAP